ncbi:MAG TPA: hypothetical protein VM935_11585, partial [Chitinophagaceae bacterium]|nr:hypothetical protein [Chitinophagaceae bacterium]
MRRSKLLFLTILFMPFLESATAQETFPVNGVADERAGHFAFTHATIIKDASTTIKDATLIIKNGKIIDVGTGLKLPEGAVEVDCSGKFIYPSFIDVFTDYGMPTVQRTTGPTDFFARTQLTSNTKGAYNWNQAIKSETDAFKIFAVDEAKAKGLRDAGFGSVLTHLKDGIARGSGAFVSLGGEKENLVLIKEKAA